MRLTWGGHGHLPDLEYTNLYLNFGSNPFEGEQWSRWLDHAIMDGKERGMKMIVIEPRFSHAAAKADEWIPMRPGKDAVFILALCEQLIDNNTIDTDFLATYTNATQLVGEDGRLLKGADGKPLVWDETSKSAKAYDDAAAKAALTGSFDVNGKAYRTAFQVLADSMKDITPEYAEEVSGVPAARTRSLAKEIATAARIGSTLMIDGHAAPLSPGGVLHLPRPVGQGIRRTEQPRQPDPQHADRQSRRGGRLFARTCHGPSGIPGTLQVRVPAQARRPGQERVLPARHPGVLPAGAIHGERPQGLWSGLSAGDADLLRHQPAFLHVGRHQAAGRSEEDLQRGDRHRQHRDGSIRRYRAAGPDLPGSVAFLAHPFHARHQAHGHPPAGRQRLQPPL